MRTVIALALCLVPAVAWANKSGTITTTHYSCAGAGWEINRLRRDNRPQEEVDRAVQEAVEKGDDCIVFRAGERVSMYDHGSKMDASCVRKDSEPYPLSGPRPKTRCWDVLDKYIRGPFD